MHWSLTATSSKTTMGHLSLSNRSHISEALHQSQDGFQTERPRGPLQFWPMPDNGKEGAGAGSQSKEIKCSLHFACCEKKTPPRHPPLWTGLPHRHRTSNSSIAVIQYVTNLKSLIHLHTHTYCVAMGMYQTIGWPHRQLGSKLQRSLQRVPHTCRKAAGCQCHLMTWLDSTVETIKINKNTNIINMII